MKRDTVVTRGSQDGIHREAIEWCDIWVSGGHTTDLPRLLLIGDSITRSYYAKVAQALQGTYACARVASSKCVGDPVLLKELDLVLSEYQFDMIHFNNGMHGWDYTEAQYAAGLETVFDVLHGHVASGRLIYAFTTPVRCGDGFLALEETRTPRVRERNQIAASLAAARGIAVNDLFAAVIEHPEYHSDRVHFNDAGQEALAEYVIASIAAADCAPCTGMTQEGGARSD